jgi:uncharacterized repeat protein (TIGR03803 family)
VRTWVLVGLLLGTVSILTACSGSGSPLSVTPEGATARQSHPDNAYKILHKFGVTSGDGIRPAAQLINVKGTLYGTTSRGGVGGVGTVFSISPSGNETVIHSFGTDGAYPVAALLYVNGTFYGTTSLGGALGGGTIFSMTPAGKVKVLHKFTADYPDQKNTGSVPEAGLIDVNGTLYGTASQGGRHSCNNGYTGCGGMVPVSWTRS